MTFSFEGYQNFYPNCPVVSGFGTPVVWCRLPNSTTQRCIASGDIKYGKVFVAQGENARYYAMNPFEGRQLQNRIEQFLKVRSQDQGAIAISHTVYTFVTLETTSFDVKTTSDRIAVVPYGSELKIWMKIDDALPVVIDTLTFNGGNEVIYGDTVLTLSEQDSFVESLGIAAINDTNTILPPFVTSNSAGGVWHHQISSNLVVVYFRFAPGTRYENRAEGALLATPSVIGALVYQISDVEGEDGEVLYRDMAIDQELEQFLFFGSEITGLGDRPSDYEYHIIPKGVGTFPDRPEGGPWLRLNQYSVPSEVFSVAIAANEENTQFEVVNIDNGAFNSSGVQRPPFAPPISAMQGWQRLIRVDIDEEGEVEYVRSPFYPAYTGLEFVPSVSESAPIRVDSVLSGHPNSIQYAYQYKAFWSLEDEFPMMVLNDEQHQSFEESEDVDPYILPNPISEVDIDLGSLGSFEGIKPRGQLIPIVTGNASGAIGNIYKEDNWLLYYLLNDDRLFHVYQRESNADAAFKVDEFQFNVSLDDLRELGAPDTCYIGSTARGEILSPEEIEDPDNWVFNLPEGMADPTVSRIAVCSGSLSWRMSEEAQEGQAGLRGTRIYLSTEVAIAPFPTRL